MSARFNNIPQNPRIVLLRPYINRWKLYKWYAPLGSHEPSLGLLYLASYIKANGYNVEIIDGEILGNKDTLRRTLLNEPDIIGITATTFSFSAAAFLSGKLREHFPRSLIIMGGSHPSALPVISLKKVHSLDGVISGEGEEALLDIIRKQDPETIKGLTWRDSVSDRIIVNKSRTPVENLDKYPIDWSLLEGFPEKYSPPFQSKRNISATMVVSRGCFYNCSFCSSAGLTDRNVRFHSPQYVVNLMREADKKYGVRDFYFHDDYFPVLRKWMEEFCGKLIVSGDHYSWSCASRVEVLSDDLLQLMKKSGCRQIGIGVESGSQKVLDKISKKIEVYNLVKGLKRITAAGIELKGYFILDTPGESLKDLFKTLKLIFQNDFSHIQFNYYTPLPGSRDYELSQADERTWKYMSLQKCLGYSAIPRRIFWVLEIVLYSAAYLKIIPTKVFNEMFNHRTKLSA